MYDTYYFSDEWSQEEKQNLIKKTAFLMERQDLPVQILKPHKLIYGENGICVGYEFRRPPIDTISLKKLFQLEELEHFKVNAAMLFQIAIHVLEVLIALADLEIYPGLIDLNYLLVPISHPDKKVFLANPELFQVGYFPSSYSWYPSDVRLFEEEIELFDSVTQKTADGKLIYKILTAASKGNAKIPPNQKAQDASWMYWNLLSREWKDYFLSLTENTVDYDQLMELLQTSLGQKKVVSSSEKANDNSSCIGNEDHNTGHEDEKENNQIHDREKAYALITILRQAEKPIHEISRELYLLQEKLEYHPKLQFDQGFVLGNKYPFTKPFRTYPAEYRSQLGHVISDYSFGESLIIAADMMEAQLKREERPSILFILLDGEIKNDKTFHIGVNKLEKLKEIWYTKLVLVPVGTLQGEGYQILKDLCKKGNKS